MSNYPPGVTGFEYEIAGPDWEEDRDEQCSNCDFDGPVTVMAYSGSIWWECPDCGHDNIRDVTDGFDDPDEER